MRFIIGTFNVRDLALPNIAIHGGDSYTKDIYGRKIAWTAAQLDRMEGMPFGETKFQRLFILRHYILAEITGNKKPLVVICDLNDAENPWETDHGQVVVTIKMRDGSKEIDNG